MQFYNITGQGKILALDLKKYITKFFLVLISLLNYL